MWVQLPHSLLSIIEWVEPGTPWSNDPSGFLSPSRLVGEANLSSLQGDAMRKYIKQYCPTCGKHEDAPKHKPLPSGVHYHARDRLYMIEVGGRWLAVSELELAILRNNEIGIVTITKPAPRTKSQGPL